MAELDDEEAEDEADDDDDECDEEDVFIWMTSVAVLVLVYSSIHTSDVSSCNAASRLDQTDAE